MGNIDFIGFSVKIILKMRHLEQFSDHVKIMIIKPVLISGTGFIHLEPNKKNNSSSHNVDNCGKIIQYAIEEDLRDKESKLWAKYIY